MSKQKITALYERLSRDEFVRVVQEAQSSQQSSEIKKQRARLTTAKQRVADLETLISMRIRH